MIAMFDLQQFSGSETFERFSVNWQYVGTEGMMYLMRECHCYWLGDLIASYADELMRREFVSWHITPNGSGVTVRATDGNETVLITQEVPWSDLFTHLQVPEGKTLKLFQVWQQQHAVVMLPGEY